MAGRTAILSVRITSAVDQLVRGFRRAERSVERFARRMDRINDSGIARTARSLGKVAAVMGAVTLATGPAIGAVGSLGLGLLALGPAALPALAAIALGFEGIKNAAKTIAPQFDALKTAVSGTFEREMAPAFAKLGGLIEQITPAMTGVASAVSGAFGTIVDVITGPGAAGIQAIIEGSQRFVTALAPGLAQLTQGMIDFGAAAAPAMTAMGAALGNLLGTFGQVFTELSRTGELTALFEGFADALVGLGNFAGPLVTLMAKLGVVMGPVLYQAFTALGDALTAATPGLQQMAQQLAPALATAFQNLAPIIPGLVQAFLPFTGAVVALVGPLTQIIAAMTPFAPVLVAVGAALRVAAVAQAALNIAMAANPIGLVVIALVALVAGIVAAYNRFEWFRNAVQAVASFLGSAFSAAASVVRSVISAAVSAVTATINRIRGVASSAASVFKSVWSGVTGVFSRIAGAISNVIGLLNRVASLASSVAGAISSIFHVDPADAMSLAPSMRGVEMFRNQPPPGLWTFAHGGLHDLGRLASAGTSGDTHITNVSVTVNGAVDPLSTARQIRDILAREARITGGSLSLRVS